MAVRIRDGHLVHFNLKDYNYIEYGYAVTTIKTQGATCKKAIMIHTADDNVKSEAFYTAATRASHELRVFTPDKARLMQASSKEQEKTSTLEFTGEGKIEAIVKEEKKKEKKVPHMMRG
jgi:ATP-dependent exoDNAse (exonuclease V) alpha subunit